MMPADVPAVLQQLEIQNARDGTSYSLPKVFDQNGNRLPNIVLALTAVDIETEEVVQGHVWERTLEHTAYGISPEATVCSMREQDAVFFLLRERGYRDVHILVPSERVRDMEHGLEKILGMSATGLTHFYRLLDPAENAELKTWYEEREATFVAKPAK